MRTEIKRGARAEVQRLTVKLPAWQRKNWRGPKVEHRTAGSSPDWPAGAVERVVFRRQDFPHITPELRVTLPSVEYFGADGWPLHTPERIKAVLDQRMRAELHRFPWRTCEWDERDWEREGRSFDTFTRLNHQAYLIRALLASPLAPSEN
jgi:hypothetical protein